MQILGLADSTPKPEPRAKTLLWPTVRNETDVDQVARQGFWLCFGIAILTLIVAAFQGPAVFIIEIFEASFFFLSGVGIRMRSRFAAIAAFSVYFAASFFSSGFGILRIVGVALLLANVRGTWLSARWRSSQTEPPPVPLNTTIGDKLADRLPIVIWPWARFVYYAAAATEIILVIVALAGTFFSVPKR